jgi:hypothetical protein
LVTKYAIQPDPATTRQFNEGTTIVRLKVEKITISSRRFLHIQAKTPPNLNAATAEIKTILSWITHLETIEANVAIGEIDTVISRMQATQLGHLPFIRSNAN